MVQELSPSPEPQRCQPDTQSGGEISFRPRLQTTGRRPEKPLLLQKATGSASYFFFRGRLEFFFSKLDSPLKTQNAAQSELQRRRTRDSPLETTNHTRASGSTAQLAGRRVTAMNPLMLNKT